MIHCEPCTTKERGLVRVAHGKRLIDITHRSIVRHINGNACTRKFAGK